jgi:N utilization substance protein A
MYFDLNYIIEQVGKEKGIPKERLIEALEEAMLSASKKKFGSHLDLEAQLTRNSAR